MIKILLQLFIYNILDFNYLQILSGSLDKYLKLWNLNTGFIERSIIQPGPINSIKVSSGKQDLVTTTDFQPVIFYNKEYFNKITLTEDKGTSASVISKCGTIAVVVTLYEVIKVINLNDMSIKSEITLKLKSNRNLINAIAISTDNKQIIVAIDEKICIYHLESGQQKQVSALSLIDKMQLITYENDDLIISGHWDGQVKIHSLEGILLRTVKMHDDHIISLAANNRIVVSCGHNGKISIYEIGDLNKPYGNILDEFFLNGFVITSLFLGNDDLLVAGCMDGKILVQNVRAKQILRIIEGHSDVVTSIQFSSYRK